jgi:SAM-dependent methyltransferase
MQETSQRRRKVRELAATDVARLWEDNADAWARQARLGVDVFRDLLNTPAFLALLPPIAGLRGLDVGCGEGANTRQLAGLGAKMSAVDIAPTFVRYAQASEACDPLGIDYAIGDAMQLPFDDGAFEFVTAFMSLMDMPDPGRALREIRRVLRPGGFVQFSILHPCFVPPRRRVLRNRKGKARAIEIGDYFESTEGRVDCWWFSTLTGKERHEVAPFRTPIFHRTLSQWFDLLAAAGLVVEKLGEPTAGTGPHANHPVIEDTRVAPMSLHVRARRTGD